jgi:hypothetical protein
MNMFRKLATTAGLAATVAIGFGASVAQAQGVQVSEIPSALDPANLKKPRPKPPFDITGVWQHDARPKKGAPNSFRFGPPYPPLKAAGQQAMKEAAEASAKGLSYRDSIGQCFPAGMPVIMTRVWPIGMIQLPTSIWMVHAFMNSLRVVYLDGRPHTDPDILINTYNGESIGKWEGDTLVIDSIGFEDDQHYIDSGIPTSEELHIVERVRMIDKDILEWTYIMTDPQNWEGEWKSTKYFSRRNMDIPEVECTPRLNERITATQAHRAEDEKK